jgi:hypothetical protein
MENGLNDEKQSSIEKPRMFTSDSDIELAARHLRRSRQIQAIGILVAVPIVLIAWAVAANLLDLDFIFASRAAMLTCAPFVIAAIFSPLLLRYPNEVRWRGYVVQWFIIALFFNIIWQMPPLVFRFLFDPVYGGVDPIPTHMTYQILWWGYHSSDLDYGYLTRFWVLAEVSFWIISALAIVALVKLWRGREKQAFTLLGVCGALQLYNVLFFLGYGGIVGLESSGKIFDNIATDSVLAPILYWLFNLLWGLAGVTASVLSFKCLFHINNKAESGAS